MESAGIIFRLCPSRLPVRAFRFVRPPFVPPAFVPRVRALVTNSGFGIGKGATGA
jgi:hypothetical protein